MCAARGFTILELLIAMAILGLIMVLLVNGLHFAGRAWDTQRREVDRSDDFFAVQNVLRQMVESGRDFDGDAATLRFVGTLPHSLMRSGLYDIELATRGGSFVLIWAPHFKGPMADAQHTVTDLATGVTRLGIGYLVPSKKGPQWQASISPKGPPPALISLDVALAGRAYPSLLVKPWIDGAPGN